MILCYNYGIIYSSGETGRRTHPMTDYFKVQMPFWLAEKNNTPMVLYGKKLRETDKAVHFQKRTDLPFK